MVQLAPHLIRQGLKFTFFAHFLMGNEDCMLGFYLHYLLPGVYASTIGLLYCICNNGYF